MEQAKKMLPRLEVLVILVFFIGFLVWAISKCGSKKSELEQTSMTVQVDSTKMDSTATTSGLPPVPDSINKVAPTNPAAPGTTTAQPTAPGQQPAAAVNSQYTRLWVTINKLKLRKGPSLDSASIAELPLFDQVYFLNEMTDSTTVLNLGYELADEPWVKVRTQKGQEGWVYGAGVHFHKKKRKGVFE